MRTTTSHHVYSRLLSNSFVFVLLLAIVFSLLPATPALAAPILTINVALAPGTVTPIPAGEPFRMRLTYECSSSLAGDECVNMQVTSTLPVELEGLQIIGNTDVQLASYDPGTNTATWIFNSPLPLGTTGQLEFEIRYLPGITVDGETATVTATISATGAVPVTSTPLNLTADSADQSTVSKVVESGGAAGDVTTYRINVCPGGAGALNLTNATITDTLPLGAVYVSSIPTPSNVNTGSDPQTIVWEGVNVTVPDCDAFRVSVNYPTIDPDNAVGNSKTNNASVTGTPFGGVEKTMTTDVLHTLAVPGPGFSLDKTADADTIVGGAVITRLRIRNTGNVQIDNVIVTDPIPAEHTVNRIDTGPAAAVAYQKNGVATWITGVPIGSNILVGSFPGFIAGDYISALRFTLGTVPVSFDNDAARIYSTIVNPPNGGGAAYTLPHNVTNTATLSGNFGGTPLTDNNDGALTEVDVPKARPTPLKAIISGSPALPGQTVRYGLTMANGNFAPLDNPVIADLLPAQVTYVPASWTLTKNITGCATTPTFSATPNFNGSGRTLLQWSWAASGCSITSGDDARIEFDVTVNQGTYPTGAGSIPNRLALVDFSTPTTLVRRNNCATDPTELAFYTGGGYDADKVCFSPAAGLRVNAAASIGSAKYVRGQLDSIFHRDPQVGQTVQGGLITYQMELANTGNVDFQNLVMVDILPYNTPAPGNVGVRDLVALGTVWTPQLAGPVTISPPIPGLTVRYSTEINPCRPNLAPTNPGCTPMTDGVAPGPGIWSLNLPSDPTAVRSLKFDFGSYVLLANQTVRFTFPMFAPDDAPIAGAGSNGVFGDNDDTNVAWNTFAYEAVRVDDGSRLVAQPPRVGIEVQPLPAGLASYGDYAWNDVNQNGSQDEPPYRGINGVTVRLYDDADGNPATTGDQTLIGTQITHNDGSGNPGYYLFPALNPGFYFAEFVAPTGFQISPRDTTADTIDSDINTVTGRTDITQLVAGENDLTWDAGFYAPVVSLGNRVWFDTNNDRLDNDGAGAVAGSSTGIPGVTVQLFFDANGDGQITGAEQNWFAQQTTDASGFYLFTAQTHSGGTALGSPVPLYPGQYVVGIAASNFTGAGPLVGYYSSGTTISNAGVISEIAAPDPNNNNTDRDDNGDTIRTPAVFYTGGVLGKPVFIDSSEPTGEPESAGNAPGPLPIADNNSNLTLDFGFYNVSMGNLVWVDDGAGGGTIANGLRDGGEVGLAGVTVRLFNWDSTIEILVGPDGLLGTADDAAGGMVTNASGNYRFGNLPQGQYRIRMTAPTGYVSTRDTAGTSSPDGNIDNDDNGPGVNAGTATSSVFTLTPGAAGALNNNTVTTATGNTHDPTIDFGIVRRYSVGNRVWNDRDNNGLRTTGEPGISGVVVRLYLSDGVTIARRIDGSNVPDSTTNVTGFYRFDNLPAGDYIVEIRSTNFTGANPLAGFRSSTGGTAGSITGPYEPASDPDNDLDNDDNGTFDTINGVARSQVITVGEGSGTVEPTSAVDADGGAISSPEAQDNQSNRTVDFGFYLTISLGNRVWEDADNNGTVNGSEVGISGVPVNLYRDNDNNGVPDGAAIGTTTTNATGYYLFTGLITETYLLEIVPPPGYLSSTGNFGAYEPGPDPDIVATDNDDNGTAGAGVIRSAPITLAVGGEPTGEPATPGLTDDARDVNANYTVDFGLFRPLSLGNLVWLDANNNGIVDGGETGIASTTVRLYRDSDTNGTPDDLAAPAGVSPADAIRSMTTNGTGHYLFTGLGAGDYIVEVVTPAGLTSSTGQTVPAPYEPAPDADTTPADDDDNGTVNAAVVRSAPVTLTAGGEPTGEPATPGLSDTTPDDNSNVTVDFGFYTALSLGNLVWLDADNSGTVNGGEVGIAGVAVRLYRDNDNDGTPDDIDGSAGVTSGDAIASTTTNGTGHYLFTGLSAGTYMVEIVAPAGHRTSTGSTGSYEPAPDADTLATDDDDNGTDASGVIRSAPVTLTIGGEPIGEPATPGITDSTADNNANYTVDFGLYVPVRIGNLVFEDVANNGVYDAGTDSPLAGATVALFEADGTTPAVDADGVAVPSQTTTATGLYLFTNLAPEQYIVRVTPPAGYYSSTDIASTANPNNDTDNDDNGVVSASIVATAAPVILTSSGEPAVAVDTDDTNGNLTIDFGFYTPVRLGNLVFEDVANNGVYNAGTDSPLAGATVALFEADGTTPAVDADGVAVASQTTTGTGLYLFTNLAPGQYVVRVTPPAGYISSTDIASTANPDNDTDNDDNGVVSAGIVASAPVTLVSGGEPAIAVDTDDTNGNLTVDFGFFLPLRLGNLVFEDIANNGVYDAGTDSPLAGATVALFAADGITPAVDADGVAVASQTTTATGLYLFTNLAPGQYVVRVTPPAGYHSSTDLASTGNPDNDTDNDDNGLITAGVVASAPVTLTSNGEPATAVDTDDISGNLTVDFGFYQLLRLGNLVFEDVANNGVYDAGTDSPLAGATVALFAADGTTPAVDADGVAVASQTTTATGLYLFTNLAPGQYVVRVTPPAGYRSSDDIASTANPDNDTDNDDNGVVSGGIVASAPATLTSNGEPALAVDTDDTSGNLTIDFGFYLPAEIGDLVWLDRDKDGVQDNPATEPGIPGVTVTLYRPGPDGTPGTADDVLVASTTTGASGDYLFTNLGAGDYFVAFTLPPGYDHSPLGGTADPTLDSDADLITGRTVVTTLVSGESDLTWDAGLFYTAGLGNRVWFDRDANGIQDTGEVGVQAVTVNLFDGAGTLIMTTTTDAGGFYSFPNLAPGDYSVGFELPIGYVFSPINQGTLPDSDSDADPVTGLTVQTTLAPGEADPTWDAGIYIQLSLGNLVWNDLNNNGIAESSESRFDGVVVNLYRDSNTNGLIDSGEFIATQTTSGGGLYLFTNLRPASYLVQLDPSNFTGAGVLVGYQSSTGSVGTHISLIGPYEPAPDPNDDVNNDDNGRTIGGQGVVSSAIVLISRAEPTNDGDSDENSNLTVDFGLFMPAGLGNLVWYDTDRDGIHDPSEAGVPGVTVTLYDTAGNPIASATTDSTGSFLFTNLPPGNYSVGFSTLPVGYALTLANQGSDDGNDSDANPTTGLTAAVTLVPGQNDLTLYAGLILVDPTAVTLASFTATSAGDHVTVAWVTTAEVNTWGFNLYRSTDGTRSSAVKVTPTLILAEGRGQGGASYTWTDTDIEQGVTYTYWLVESEVGGSTNEYGPATVQLQQSAVEYLVFLPMVVR